MNSHVTERNTQIIAAYTAGNRNKSELARYFGVSATTVRRVLAGVVMTMTATSAAHADLLKDYTDMGFSNFTAKWVNMTASEQATVREALRSEGHENLLIDLGDKLNQSAPEIIQPAPPQAAPHTQTVTPTLAAQLTPQATPQATPQKLPVAPTLTAQLTPQATPQATPQKMAVAPTLTAQLTPQATPQATPQKLPVAPTLTAQLTPQATPQATPQKLAVTPTLTAQLTPQATPQATPQKMAVAPTLTAQLTPQATPQATPQKLAVAPTLTAQLTPQATPQATPQKLPVAPTLTAQLTPQATPQATPQKLAVAPTLTAQLTPQATPQATPQKLAVAPTLTAQLTPQATPQATPQKLPVTPTLTAQLTPQATPQATPQKLAVAPTLTEQSTVDKTPIRAANSSTVQEVTSTPAQQPVVKQEVRSTYYDKQITALNAAAEQDHAEVLAESHSRAVGDANTLSQANDYTNKKFSDLKSEVDDNKDQANAGTASALAAVGIPQVEAGSDFMVGAGAGTYGNQSAIAVGVSGHITAKTVTKLAVTGDTNNGVGASAGIGWNF